MPLRTFLLSLAFASACAAALAATPTVPATAPLIFLEDSAVLPLKKARIQARDAALMPAYALLLEAADKGLQQRPVSVMEKQHAPPSGDKHDYMSLAPYHWPDPSKPGGLPYMRKDGQTNPEVRDYSDKAYLPPLTRSIHTLALAWYFSNDARYAEHASLLIRVWFLDPATRMNPNLKYGQAIKGVNTGRGSGLIDTRHLLRVVDAIGLLQGAPAWRAQDQAGMQAWMAQFLDWMQTSDLGQDEMATHNNHGIWYDAQRLSFALFSGQQAHALKIVDGVKTRIDQQMDKNGFFPAEMARTMSLHYAVFALEPLFTIARMASTLKVDLVGHTSPSGKSLQKGFDALLPYLNQSKPWVGQQIRPFDFSHTVPLLAMAAASFDCSACAAAVKRLTDQHPASSRVYLTESMAP